MILSKFSSQHLISEALDQVLIKASKEAIAARGIFTIALSGGSLAKIMGFTAITDVSNWHFFWADERCVALDHSDSNQLTFAEYFETLKVPIQNRHTIDPDLIDDAEAAAQDYKAKMVEEWYIVALIKGPDGHTCSLFPGHPLLSSLTSVAAIYDSPKPPSTRITLTMNVLLAARVVVYIVTGESKADVLHRIIDLGEDFPAGRVKPMTGNLYWFLDNEAAKLLD